MTVCDHSNNDCSPPVDSPGWPHLYEYAATRLLDRLDRDGELSPAQVSTTVLSALPRALAARIGRWLAPLDWLSSDTRIPFDLFESSACPPGCAGWRREFARLAVFGVPGEGLTSDAKRREAVFQRRCGEILREVRDLESLSYAAARALGHPEVHGDPVLVGMLRVFISEREAELRSSAHLPSGGDSYAQTADQADLGMNLSKPPLRERVHLSLMKLRQEFVSHDAAYAIGAARETLDHIKDLRRRYPAHVDAKLVEECDEKARTLEQRRDEFRVHLDELVQHAGRATENGDQKTAAWVRRRLDAVHANLPAVLPLERLEAMKETLRQCGERQERHEVARRLVAREQAVGADVKRISKAVHDYQALLQQPPQDPQAARRIVEAYDQACEQLGTYDDEWLADLMIELDCLLVDLRGSQESQSRAAAQVDKFVENVRDTLQRMIRTVREIERNRAGAGR